MRLFNIKQHQPEGGVIKQTSLALYLLVVFMVAWFLSGCIPITGATPTTEVPTGKLASVLQSGILVVASDPEYPPQSQLNNDEPRLTDSRCSASQYTANQWTGLDIDVAVEVARRLGVEACFVAPTWSQIVAGNWNDRWDIHVGSMVITEERMGNFYFSQPYINGEAVAFVHQENQAYDSLSDLSGKRIGVCTGCAYESYLNKTLSIPGINIEYLIQDAVVVGYDTDTSALADLALGDGLRLDAVITDPDTGSEAIQNGLPIKQLDEVVYHDYSAIAIDKYSSGDPIPLVSRLTEIIQSMHTDGFLLAISQKYYNGDFTSWAADYDVKALDQYP
jgi:polar amino acid transport system substrate-binding protein